MTTAETTGKEAKSRKRPVLVWIIALFYILSGGWTIISFTLILSGAVVLNEPEQAYFDAQTNLDILLTIIIGAANLSGAIFLLLLRRYAYYCFLGAFSLSILLTAYHILFKNWLTVIGGPGLLGSIIGWLISIAIILYAKKLITNSILQ
jgi:hypothetical protein